jgi:dTDP-4-amino-4,6-dideoxygalactose transaminase
MKIPFLDLKAQYKQIADEVVPMVTTAMENGAFIGGPQVKGFEEEFAAFCDSKYCVGVASGTDALRFALMAVGAGPGTEVITVPNTFIATTEAISQVGAVPVFVDIRPDTCTLDAENLEDKITGKTRAIVPVHLYGQPADMDPILAIARKHGLAMVEDACQAHGALYKQKKAGSMGQVGCFSFYPGKNLGAFGEAGAIVTQDESIAGRIKTLRDHGQKEKYFHEIEGYNGRLDAIQGGVLRIKLKRLADWNESRRKNAAYYNKRLSAIPGIQLPIEADYARSVYHLYVIHTDRRDELQRFLSEKGIATGLHYPRPLHLQNAYSHLGLKEGSFPAAENSARRLLSLPMFPELTQDQMDYVADSIKAFVG